MGQDVAGASLGTQNILTKHAWDETPRGLEFELPGAQPLSPQGCGCFAHSANLCSIWHLYTSCSSRPCPSSAPSSAPKGHAHHLSRDLFAGGCCCPSALVMRLCSRGGRCLERCSAAQHQGRGCLCSPPQKWAPRPELECGRFAGNQEMLAVEE